MIRFVDLGKQIAVDENDPEAPARVLLLRYVHGPIPVLRWTIHL